jgi:hypothetical protein
MAMTALALMPGMCVCTSLTRFRGCSWALPSMYGEAAGDHSGISVSLCLMAVEWLSGLITMTALALMLGMGVLAW